MTIFSLCGPRPLVTDPRSFLTTYDGLVNTDRGTGGAVKRSRRRRSEGDSAKSGNTLERPRGRQYSVSAGRSSARFCELPIVTMAAATKKCNRTQ